MHNISTYKAIFENKKNKYTNFTRKSSIVVDLNNIYEDVEAEGGISQILKRLLCTSKGWYRWKSK